MKLKNKLGLKYPDHDIIRFFFKNELDKRRGHVIEFGCGNGNNLELFAEYGWRARGIDNNPIVIGQGKQNKIGKILIWADMRDTILTHELITYDVILFPSSLYYLSESDIEMILSNMRVKPNCLLFLKMRGYNDYRRHSYRKSLVIDYEETGEKGCTNTFYGLDELVKLLEKYFIVENLVKLNADWENLMRGKVVNNSEIIIWCNITNKADE